MEVYTITEEDINNAVTYIPAAKKMEFVRAVAERCFDTLDISSSNGNGKSSLPSCYKINTDAKTRYMMGALVGLYLQKDYERDDPKKDEWLMSLREYDMYAGGHILETINRMKNMASVRDKCFGILSDYSELKYRLDSDIKGLMNAMNDPASRILAYIEMTSSPAELQKAMEAMEQNQEVLDKYMKDREKNLEEAVEEKNVGDKE